MNENCPIGLGFSQLLDFPIYFLPLAGAKGLEPLTPGFGVWDRTFCPVMLDAEVSTKSAFPHPVLKPMCRLVIACLISLAGNWPEGGEANVEIQNAPAGFAGHGDVGRNYRE